MADPRRGFGVALPGSGFFSPAPQFESEPCHPLPATFSIRIWISERSGGAIAARYVEDREMFLRLLRL